MNRSRKNKKLSSFGSENFIKFWMLKVLTLQKKKKMMKDVQEEFGMLKINK